MSNNDHFNGDAGSSGPRATAIDENHSKIAATQNSTFPSATPSHSAATGRQRGDTIGQRMKNAPKTFGMSNPPEGFFAATGDIASSIAPNPNLPPAPVSTAPLGRPQQNGEYANTNKGVLSTPLPPAHEAESERTHAQSEASIRDATAQELYANGYHFPPKLPLSETWPVMLKAAYKYTTSPVGFLVVLYGLNVVAWGGMIFLLLCKAAPAMCNPTCDDFNSPRRKWMEIDGQILNALFCVTGFGLAPWRFRDLYFLLQYRILGKHMALRRLAGIHNGWFRLPGSDRLPIWLGPDSISSSDSQYSLDSVPHPISTVPNVPRTGVRAPPTKLWKMDYVLWMNVSNTFLQVVLCVFMWGFNRRDRSNVGVGLAIGVGCGVAALGGIMMFTEGRKVKGIEGVAVTSEDLERLAHDHELGIPHYNNLKDKKPKESKASKESKDSRATKEEEGLSLSDGEKTLAS